MLVLRLERINDSDRSVTIRLHGRLGGEWVDELRMLCKTALADSAFPLRLDLEHVTFIDHDGLALLQELWDDVLVTRSSLFATELLKSLPHRTQVRGRHAE